ncbi:MAG: hypothetical protein H0T69_04650 [Thermoleophilaceae bacterium]|nr:hypothetical protein [Thermoleophilaceae bacterium]
MRFRVFAAMLASVLVTLALASSASATLPVTKSRPFQAVCEAQGGTFLVSIDLLDLYCDKEGGLFTAFRPAQLAVQRRLCEHVYGAFFGVQGFIRPDGVTGTGTFCATSA